MPVVGWPSTRTSPAFGSNCPSTQLNSVDFPEPFGPMIPRISPSRTSKDTSLTAVMPPNDLRRLDTSSTALMGRHSWVGPFDAQRRSRRGTPGRRFRNASDQAEQAGWAERHHDHDQRGIEEQIISFREPRPFRQQHGDQRANERT